MCTGLSLGTWAPHGPTSLPLYSNTKRDFQACCQKRLEPDVSLHFEQRHAAYFARLGWSKAQSGEEN